MVWWNPGSWGRQERRAIALPDGKGNAFQFLFGSDFSQASTGITVTTDNALMVPAVSAAVNFIAETIASLPLEIYRTDRAGNRTEDKGPLANLLAGAVNDELSSFEWRKGLMVAKLTTGRGLTYIERSETGQVLNLWPMDPQRTTVRRDGWRTSYVYNRPDGSTVVYAASEVIDLPFMLRSDGFTARSPIAMGHEAIGLALAATQYGAKFLANGGVPPFAVTGNFQSSAAMKRAGDDFAAAVKKAAAEERQALILPDGLKIDQIGANPEQSQLVDLQRFCIEQVARIYQLPPTFLQDLSHGTYSNTEQQDLHFAKHTVLHHVEQLEQELNLKLFGRRANSRCVELEMDGLLRGDFKTRMEGWARAIQSGLVKPNEARAEENYPAAEGGDQLFMQGATVPIDQAGTVPAASAQSNGGLAE